MIVSHSLPALTLPATRTKGSHLQERLDRQDDDLALPKKPQTLADLLLHHIELTVHLQSTDASRQCRITEQLCQEEQSVLLDILAWQPARKEEAVRKIEYLAAYVLATQKPIGRGAAAEIIRSVEVFLSKRE